MIEGTFIELRQLREDVEGESTGSSGSNSSESSSSWDVDLGTSGSKDEHEDGEEVNQVEDLTPTPVIVPLALV